MLSNYSTNLRDSAYEYARSNVTETAKCALPWKRMTKLNPFIRIHSLHLSIVQGFYDPQANRLFHISSLRSSLRKLDIRLGITKMSSSHILSTRNVLDQEDNGHEKVKPQEDDGLNQAEDEDEFDEEEEDDSGEDEDLIIDEDEGEEDHELETEEEEDEDELDTEADDTEDDGDTEEDEFDEDEDEDELDLDEDEDDEDEYDLDVA